MMPPPPTAKDAERWVMGSILLDPSRCLPDVLKAGVGPADFTTDPLREIFATATDLHRKGEAVDPALICSAIGESEYHDTLADLAGYVGNVMESVPTTAHVAHYTKILRNATVKRQVWRAAVDAVDATANGKAGREIANELHATLDDLLRDADPATKFRPMMTAAEFMATDDTITMLVNNTAVAGQGGLISARSKSNKTTVALDLTMSLASGSPFLGVHEVPKALPSGIITGESGGPTIKETMRRIAHSKGFDVRDLKNFHVDCELPNLTTPEGLDYIERRIDYHQLAMLVVDPTYLTCPGIEDSQLAKMAPVLAPISGIIERTGCSIVMVHHNRKTARRQGGDYDEPNLEDINGTGWQQWARWWLLINRRREWDPTTGQHWLWLCAGGSGGFGYRKFLDIREGLHSDPGGRVWDVSLSDPSEALEQEREERQASKESKQLEADRRAVCNALAAHPEGLTRTKACELSGVSRRRWASTLEVMLDLGEIEVCEVTIGNQKTPREGIKLVSEQTSEAA